MAVSEIIYWALISLLLVGTELIYFKIAERFSIIDKPNQRSSHSVPVIRGGGIIFVWATLAWFCSNDFPFPFFIAGILLIAIISFLDDITSLNPLVRFSIHLVSVLLMLIQLSPINWPIYLVLLAVVFIIGTLNAFNFMDGINGITGIYSLVTLATFAWVQTTVLPFSNLSLIVTLIISVLIFLFFNFRNRARCFAGDVGSISIAFILIFLLLQLIQATNNFLWPLLFLVYGLDSVVTIVYRISQNENIFQPHRTHLYQYLSNELKWPHHSVAILYGAIQLAFNLLLVSCLSVGNNWIPVAAAIFLTVVYFFVRRIVVTKIRLSNSSFYPSYVKRTCDIILAALILFFFSWLFLFIIILYLLFFQFPFFFWQERIGKNLKTVKVIKFRTLSETAGTNEQRRFLLGDFLRQLSLDELPQVWNVLKGEMSFIGPRPLPTEYLSLFTTSQLERHSVRPGITGWAQVNGRHSISWQQKFELDLHYIKHISLSFDFLIFCKTIVLLLSFRKDKSLSEEKFTGN